MIKLNTFFIIMMIIGTLLVLLALFTEHPLLLSITGYSMIFGSSIGYSLNGGK